MSRNSKNPIHKYLYVYKIKLNNYKELEKKLNSIQLFSKYVDFEDKLLLNSKGFFPYTCHCSNDEKSKCLYDDVCKLEHGSNCNCIIYKANNPIEEIFLNNIILDKIVYT